MNATKSGSLTSSPTVSVFTATAAAADASLLSIPAFAVAFVVIPAVSIPPPVATPITSIFFLSFSLNAKRFAAFSSSSTGSRLFERLRGLFLVGEPVLLLLFMSIFGGQNRTPSICVSFSVKCSKLSTIALFTSSLNSGTRAWYSSPTRIIAGFAGCHALVIGDENILSDSSTNVKSCKPAARNAFSFPLAPLRGLCASPSAVTNLNRKHISRFLRSSCSSCIFTWSSIIAS
mmetsp:Transcript_4054/g.12507  ORF Transcript_4054/g.12507 Transcript_4054/m.12507 type:complete len:232 (-) Transcript_4054:310-1005(-)